VGVTTNHHFSSVVQCIPLFLTYKVIALSF
jgi:hypothetical protein